MKILYKIIIMFISILLVGIIQAQVCPNFTIEKQGLKGKVKNLKEIGYSANMKFGKIKKGDIKTMMAKEYLFDKNGKINELVLSRIGARIRFEQNKGIIEKSLIYDSANNIIGKNEYTYDSIGNLVLEISNFENEKSSSTYRYDDKGKLIEEISQHMKRNFIYDESGYLIRTSSYGNNDILIQEMNYVNDSNGNMIEWDVVNYLGFGVKFKYEYEYDSKGNWVKSVLYSVEEDNIEPSEITERIIEYYN